MGLGEHVGAGAAIRVRENAEGARPRVPDGRGIRPDVQFWYNGKLHLYEVWKRYMTRIARAPLTTLRNITESQLSTLSDHIARESSHGA